MFLLIYRDAQARRGEEIPNPDALQDPDDERNLFAGTVYEADDEEADRIWEGVDAKMDERRKKQREIAEAKIAEEERRKNPKLQTQFADLKRGLSSLTDADWEGIPEAGNMTGKRRKHNMRLEENQNGRSYAVSDSVLAGAAARGQMLGELDAAQQEARYHSLLRPSADILQNGGFDTPAGDGALTDFVSIGTARDKVLSLRLDQASKDATNGSSTSVDPRGYMTALNSQILQTDAQIG